MTVVISPLIYFIMASAMQSLDKTIMLQFFLSHQ